MGNHIVSSKFAFRSKLFDVKEERIQLTTGNVHTHENVYRHPTITVFPITPKHEIYLIKQYRYLLNQEVLEAVAGFVDKNESPLAAARRELQEETGIVANQWEEFQKIYLAASVVKGEVHQFIAKGLEVGVSKPEETETISLVKLSLEEAVEKVLRREITTSGTIAGILFLNELKRRKLL